MIEELDTVNKLLFTALDRYRNACSALLSRSERTPSILQSQALLDCVSKELSSIRAYETIIQEAKATINQTRNLIPTLSPSNTLPDEIWGQIFHLVRDMHPCYLQEKTNRDLKMTRTWYPELLSHVCSRWRRIAISLPSLWTHIDILPDHPHSKQLYARATTFASRGKSLSLSLHLDDHRDSVLDSDLELSAFCASVSTRTRALKVTWPHLASHCQLLALRSCLTNCEPGMLQELSLIDNCGIYAGLPIDQPGSGITGFMANPANWCLDLPGEFIERLMAPVQKLFLSGLNFDWASRAYSGLIELYLLPLGRGDSSLAITPPELVRVLESSPQLRVLHFGIRIYERHLHPHLVPAQLKHSEVLDLRYSQHDSYPKFFTLLSPDTKPLRLSLGFYSEKESPLSDKNIKSFFRDSNITELYMDGPFDGVWLPDLLEILPRLQALVLTNFDILANHPTSDTTPPPRLRHFETLRLLHCTIGIPEFHGISRMYPIQTLIIWSCDYQLAGGLIIDSHDKARQGYFDGTASIVCFIDTPPPDRECIVEERDPWE